MKHFFEIFSILFVILFIVSFSFALCGNGVLDSDEQCDGNNFGLMTCEKLDKGYIGGQLTCNTDCTINTVGCYFDINALPDMNVASCGDGILQAPEQCDTNDFGVNTCETLGYVSGNLSCNSRCLIEVNNCKTQIQNEEQNDQNTIVKNTSIVVQVVEVVSSYEFLTVAIIVIVVFILLAVSKLNAQKDEEERKEIISKIRNKK